MQIFDDSKKRIGTLAGFRNREIVTMLRSGDKELTFEYPVHGRNVDCLKEEYYIRTKTDEFVIKEKETSGEYNKYTATLNVEGLEGQSYPYGFASMEQTIRACLEFAFEGTGWTVGTCTVTKRRTIDKEGSTTAWDVLQDCLKTYRCECIIDSIGKRVNIYEQIGQDKGCYFVEGVNLRKLTPKSDTYEFYTRIIPLGKDGISIEWLHGKEYLENYQYSRKIKTYTWKDERYTNTTSLMEDAEAKLEELSKPYTVYSADVVDLAAANPEYKNILAYGIGDTVRMVSKSRQTQEKQRIVKIVERPEEPEKNTVELSNTTKTFAEVQKAETELAKQEAISISNNKTKKILQDGYYTKKEVESHITASEEKISLGVSETYETKKVVQEKIDEANQRTDEKLTEYSTTEEMRSAIELSAQNINLEVSKTYATQQTVTEKYNNAVKSGQEAAAGAEAAANKATDEKLTEYSTTEEMRSAIELSAQNINLEVSKTYATQQTVTEKCNNAVKSANAETNKKLSEYSTTEEMRSAISMSAENISLVVSRTYATQSNVTEKCNSAITAANQATDRKLSNYSTTQEMRSAIEMSAEGIRLTAGKISWKSNYSSMSELGELICERAKINGQFETADTSGYYCNIKNGVLDGGRNGVQYGRIRFNESKYTSEDGTMNGMVIQANDYLDLRIPKLYVNFSKVGVTEKITVNLSNGKTRVMDFVNGILVKAG